MTETKRNSYSQDVNAGNRPLTDKKAPLRGGGSFENTPRGPVTGIMSSKKPVATKTPKGKK